jgi:hypothetical protein
MMDVKSKTALSACWKWQVANIPTNRVFIPTKPKPIADVRPTMSDIVGWPFQQLQCVGCDRNFLWDSVGLPLVSLVRVGLCWACWYLSKLINVLECGL